MLRVVRKSVPRGEKSVPKAAGAHRICGKASVAGTVLVRENTLEDGVENVKGHRGKDVENVCKRLVPMRVRGTQLRHERPKDDQDQRKTEKQRLAGGIHPTGEVLQETQELQEENRVLRCAV
ncbi:hypothetical protein HispidOSU_029917 [Sigmodon hispidus]